MRIATKYLTRMASALIAYLLNLNVVCYQFANVCSIILNHLFFLDGTTIQCVPMLLNELLCYCCFDLFSGFNIASINIRLIQFHHLVSGHPYNRLPWGLLLKYLTCCSLTIHSINIISPIQLTYSDKLKYI